MKLKQKKNKKSGGWDYFDDCLICQAMQEGKANTLSELQEVFRKQEEKSRQRYSKKTNNFRVTG